MLNAYANGIDNTAVAYGNAMQEVKSVGNSTTIPYDVEEREEAYKILLSLAETVSMRLREGRFCAREIGVVIKTQIFKCIPIKQSCLMPLIAPMRCMKRRKKFLMRHGKKEPIRHLGIRAGHLCSDQCIQLSILDGDWSKQKQADAAMDVLRGKYGRETIVRSTFIGGIEPAYGGGSLKINHLRKVNFVPKERVVLISILRRSY